MSDEMNNELRPELVRLNEHLAKTGDEHRADAKAKRHGKNFRTARENLEDLVDPDSFLEYGQLAVAAQRTAESMKTYSPTQLQMALLLEPARSTLILFLVKPPEPRLLLTTILF